MNSVEDLIASARQQSDNPLEQINLLEYWAIVYRNKWGIVGLSVVVCALTIVVVFSLTPIYQSTATLLIESNEAKVVSIEEVYGIDSSQREYYLTQFQILNSSRLANRVIQNLSLRTHPEYDPTRKEKSFLSRFLPTVTPAVEPNEDQISLSITKQFADNLTVTPIRNTQLVKISFDSEDPELAARVANELGNAYIESHLEARLELTQKASSWLTERLGGMRRKLEETERALREFQEQENLVDVEGVLTINANELEEQTRKLVEARDIADAAKNQYLSAGPVDGSYNPRWESLSGVLQDQLSQKLKQEEAEAENEFSEVAKRYGPKHPRYIAVESKVRSAVLAYQSRVRQVVSSFKNISQQAESDRSSIEEAFQKTQRKIQDINRKSYELSQLQRAVVTNKQLYDMFFQRFQETNQIDFEAANARFVDYATRSYDPIKPRKRVIVALAGMLSLVAGIFLAH